MKLWQTDGFKDMDNKLHRGSKWLALSFADVSAFDILTDQEVHYTYAEAGGKDITFKKMVPLLKPMPTQRIFPTFYNFAVTEIVMPELTYNVRTKTQVTAMTSLLAPRLNKIEDDVYKQCLKHGRYIYRVYTDGSKGPFLCATKNLGGGTVWCMHENFALIVSKTKLQGDLVKAYK